MARKPTRLSQNELFAVILVELTEAIGDLYVTEKLIEATNQLVKLIEREFQSKNDGNRGYYANFYTDDTVKALTENCWRILSEHVKMCPMELDIYNPYFLRDKLKFFGINYD